MKQFLKRGLVFLLAALMCLSLALPAFAAETSKSVTILFTHDLHSHLLPAVGDNGREYGGFARLMTAIRQQKALHPDAVLVDGGDFSMGSLFQTAYPTSAIELRMLGAMGYDATTFGNHEFDYLPTGLAGMLTAAANSGEPVPTIVDANYLPPKEGQSEEMAAASAAMDAYGVKEYVLLERGGVHFALFGLTGIDSDDCAPNSGMVLEDAKTAAQRAVDNAAAECRAKYGTEPIVIALSHSGTSHGEGEDYELAQAVAGIDVIVSGHTHTALPEPIEVNGTYIVSAGEYAKNLGVLELTLAADGTVTLSDYSLIPIDDTVEDDAEIAALVESFKTDVERDYLSKYGMTYDQILTVNSYKFDTVDEVYDTAHESTLGNLFSDAYKWAVEQTMHQPVDIAVTASGVIRETIPLGNVTVSDIFNAASLGVGTEGELVSLYLTGKDLRAALEVDASVYPLMHTAQLFVSGAEYSFNTNRMLFNKVDYAMLRRPDGTLEPIDNEKLYHVVAGMYMGQMLGSVKDSSFGLLSITPRDENGEPIAVSELKNHVVRDENGTPLKEWYAIASYLQQTDDSVDAKYQTVDGRKVVYSSLNPVKLLRNANKFTYILLAVLLVLILAVVLIIRGIVRLVKKRKNRKG